MTETTNKKALHRLMQAVARAQDVHQVYESALNCLQEALGVMRASLLVFDDAGVMRFVAWRGLSDTYRVAVEGHSPWRPDSKQATPLLVPDAAKDANLAEYLDVFARENIAALAFIPLTFNDAVLGKFMLYYAEPHQFTEEEVLDACAIAGHVAFAVAHHQLRSSLEEKLKTEQALAHENALLYQEAAQARATAERTAERLRILEEAAAILAPSLDPDTALEKLARHATTTIADYCVTYSFDGRVIRRVGMCHRLNEKQPLVERLVDAGAPSLGDRTGAGAVIRTGEALLAPHIPPDVLRAGAQNSEHLQVLQQLKPCSTILVPLLARDRVIGAVAFVTTEDSGRHYDEADFVVAKKVASRAALLVDNARLYSQAQRAIRARDDTVAIVSHDLRTPLHNISMASELLSLDASPQTFAKCHSTIHRATHRMERLISDLLDVARIEGSGLQIQPTKQSVVPLLHEAVATVQSIVEEKSIVVEYDVPEEKLLEVSIDRERMLQALANVVGNAVKFVGTNGKVRLAAHKSADCVTITCTDNGPGIQHDHALHLFDRFWQVDRRSSSGIGLGLAIVKGIMEAHGGSVRVNSSPGEGATFFLVLPLPQVQAESPLKVCRTVDKQGTTLSLRT